MYWYLFGLLVVAFVYEVVAYLRSGALAKRRISRELRRNINRYSART